MPRRRRGEHTDDDLVRRGARGDLDAAAQLDARYRRRLVAYARSLLGRSHHDAEDVVQDVLVKAHAEIAAGRGPQHLGPWLYRLTRNRSIDEVRRARWGEASLDDLPAGIATDALADVDDPPNVLHRRESLRTMVQDLADLPVKQRSALLARVVDGDSPADSATRLGVSVEAVQMLVVRGRANLEKVRTIRRATGDVETQLLALASPAAIVGLVGAAKVAGAGGVKLLAAGVAAVVAVAGGLEVERSQHAGPGERAPFLVAGGNQFIGHSVARGARLPAGSAVAAVTVKIPAGPLDAAHRSVTLRCPSGMVYATTLWSSGGLDDTYAQLVGGYDDPRPDGTVRFRIAGRERQVPALLGIRVLCRRPGRDGSLAFDPRLPHADEGRGVLCHEAYFFRQPEHLVTGTVFAHQKVTITRHASRSVYMVTDTHLRGWIRTAALCPGWTLPPKSGGAKAAAALAAAHGDSAEAVARGEVPGVMAHPLGE
ncbi:MAG: RNA polymerase sigma factor [Solirubrobacteraceae bacterium]